MVDYAATFGPALRALREAHGVSQYRLAELADMDNSFISRLERGERAPGRDAVESLIRGLELGHEAGNALRLAAGYAPR